MEQTSQIFDPKQRSRQLKRALGHYAQHDFLHNEMVERLVDRVADTTRQYAKAAFISPFPLADVLRTHSQIGEVMHITFNEDEVLLLPEGQFDLVCMPTGLGMINDVPGALIQARRALKPDGLFLGMVFGGQTLHELRHALGHAEADITGGMAARLSPLIDVRDAGSLLSRAGFALPVVDAEKLHVSYKDMFRLMRDLRFMGEGNALMQRPKHFTRRQVFQRAAELYHQTFADGEGRIPATFELVTLTGWSPHESQQQPLKRGSAELSLKRFLQDD